MNALGTILTKVKISTHAAYGLVVLAVLLGTVMLGHVRDYATQAKTETEYAARELSKLNSIKNSDLWEQRAQESAIALKEWQSVKWQGETVGVLAAKIQQELMKQASKVKLRNPRINVGSEIIEVDGETIMRFSLSGTASSKSAVPELLLAMAEGEKKLVVDEAIADFYLDRRSIIRLSGLAIVQVINRDNKPGSGA
ncbi:MAG: hypothetical protein Q9M33_07455 [Robiginitomaculum sp.]|nr:hypothetical protein [Robiginitomaculum sp.]MDQ7077619.1 hypothetical protein [Robiginitomaculum sp.]